MGATQMIRYLLAGAALVAIAAPVQARDHSYYFGLEIGGMWPHDSTVENRTTGAALFDVNHKAGVDGDLILGHDFGLIRAEIEAGHKWAKHDNLDLASGGSIDGDGHTSGYSTMGNLLIDLGKNETVNFYVGGGAGIAWMHERTAIGNADFNIRDSRLAWQGIAGVRAPVFRYFDVGLKYRYFNAGHLKDGGLRGEFQSHSLLASLIYNFGPEAAPPPPPALIPPPPPAAPPPPPATQTCPDGSVILATDACPVPPPPPPPPPPAPERG
jgi:opacity protein-like surface antigen